MAVAAAGSLRIVVAVVLFAWLPASLSACPAEWIKACPGEPCAPLKTPYPEREVMSFHADGPRESWRYYNWSIITTVITGHHETEDILSLVCEAHKHNVRIVYFGFSDSSDGHVALLHNSTYRKEFIQQGIRDTVMNYPWIDGINIDLEHFSRNASTYDPEALTSLVCDIQRALHANGLRLHSQDMAPWGSYQSFNMTALAQCMDFVLPMGYCDPQSGSLAGPTVELDVLRNDFVNHRDNRSNPGRLIWTMPAEKIILGLPFFGYNFECINAAPVPFPPVPVGGGPPPRCVINDTFPMTDHFVCVQLYHTETVTSGPDIGFDPVKGSAWFEYKNSTTGKRHQVWFEDPRAVHAKAQFAFDTGIHGVAFWRGNEIYGVNNASDREGADSADARAMWQAAAPANHRGGYGGRGFHSELGFRSELKLDGH